MRVSIRTLLAWATLAGAAIGAAIPATLDSRQSRSCNGSPQLCDRRYSDVTFVGSHDSAFVGPLPTDNQFISVAKQLSLGVRFLQSQSHLESGSIELCHTTCLEKDAGTLGKYLAPVKAFLDANPNEVVTLLITNGDAIPVAQFATVFQSAGLASYAFTPSHNLGLADWPTLGQLIDSGKRLIVFMDYHADTSAVPYILDEFTYYFETPYDTTDPSFPQCTVDRPPGANTNGRMALVNHFLDLKLDIFGNVIFIPDVLDSPITNSYSSISAQTDLCKSASGRTPNVVLLDYIDQGEAMKTQNKLNGL